MHRLKDYKMLTLKLLIGRGQDKTFSTLEVILRVIEGTYPFKNNDEIEFLNLYAVKEAY